MQPKEDPTLIERVKMLGKTGPLIALSFVLVGLVSVSTLALQGNKTLFSKASELVAGRGGIKDSPSYTTTATLNYATSPRHVSKLLFGFNYDGYRTESNLAEVYQHIDKPTLQSLGMQSIRFPGGWPALFYDYPNPRMKYQDLNNNIYHDNAFLSVPDMRQFATDMNNTEIVYQMSYPPRNPNIIQNNAGGVPRVTPSLAKAEQFVRTYSAVGDARGIKYYELSNEDMFFEGQNGINSSDVQAATNYLDDAQAYANRMKSVNPNIKIGINGWIGVWETDTPRPYPSTIIAGFNGANKRRCLNNTVDCFDFIVEHPYDNNAGYGTPNPGSLDGSAAFYPAFRLERHFNGLKTLYSLNGSPKFLALTEWNNSDCWNTGSPQRLDKTVEHGMYLFEELMTMARTGVGMANYHDLTVNKDGCSTFSSANGLYAPGQILKLASVAQSGSYLDTTVTGDSRSFSGNINGTYPYAAVHSIVKDNHLYVFIDNRSNQSNNVSVNFANLGVVASSPTATVSTLKANSSQFSQQTFDTSSDTQLSFSGTSFTYAAPAVSITRVDITLTQNVYCSSEFTDVPTTDPFYTYIHCLACKSVLSGYGSEFRPSNPMTRAQLSKVLVNAKAFPLLNPATATFRDVPSTNSFYTFVETAVAHNLVSGYGCGGAGEPCPGQYFRPNANVTRSQAAKMIVLAKPYTLVTPSTATFRDVPTTHPFYTFVETAAANGLINGYGCGGTGEPCPGQYFRPGNDITRAQASKVIYNAFFPNCSSNPSEPNKSGEKANN
jgi:hypothetical protein